MLPVVGRRDRPAQVIGEYIVSANLIPSSVHRSWTDKAVLDTIDDISHSSPHTFGGLLIFIDEMGKFLEAAANSHTDIYLFQELAERASRSGKRLVVVGILHQAFEEYSHRISRGLRDEWSKIQGRFVDLAINASGDEQIDLISRAIESDLKPDNPGPLAKGVAAQTRREAPEYCSRLLEDLLASSSDSRQPARPHFTPSFRSEPTKHLRFSQFSGTLWFPGFHPERQ